MNTEITNYFDELSNEMLEKILYQCPVESSSVCRKFFYTIPSALKEQWNALKSNEALPFDFRNRLVQIEENLQTADGRSLIHAFFTSLNRPEKRLIKELDFGNIGSEMSKAFQVDQDYNLVQFWPEIVRLLNLQHASSNPQEIRIWMSCEINQHRLAQIQWLNLSKLKLTTLPQEIFYFNGLTELYLIDNKLTRLPDAIGNLTALTKLHIGSNQLTRLPDTIGNLASLRQLGLSKNQFTKLPDTISNLKALTELDLRDNTSLVIPSWVLEKFMGKVQY